MSRWWVALICVGAALWLAACNLGSSTSETPAGAATEAAQTVQAVLTRAGPNIVATGQALQTPLASSSPTTTARAPSETTSEPCENRAGFVDDVTVRDNKEFAPGESFVKIWRLRNEGDCTWTPAYLLAFFGGHRLDAPETVPLSTQVEPGQLVDLAVEMNAPQTEGTYQGFWQLRSPDGQYFGIGQEGEQSFWVKIIVSDTDAPTVAATPTPTASPTSALTATPSATPGPSATPSATPESTPTPTSTATPTLTPTADS